MTFSLRDEDGKYRSLRATHAFIKGLANQGKLLSLVDSMIYAAQEEINK